MTDATNHRAVLELRASERGTPKWRALDEMVAKVLAGMKERGVIAGFTRVSDRRDMQQTTEHDFRILRDTPKGRTEIDFMVTGTLLHRDMLAKAAPNQWVFCFALEAKPATVQAALLEKLAR